VRQRIGLALNVALRLQTLYFLAEVLRGPNDPRFAGKAIPMRNLVVVLAGTSLLPLLALAQRRRWARYPAWLDDLYLSIYWLDMAGNSFDLYDRFRLFDLVPHFHGTGALAVTLRGLGLSSLAAFGLSNVVHMLLEAQEYYTDVLFGTHNVHGPADTVNDLLAGLAGTVMYGLVGIAVERRFAAA